MPVLSYLVRVGDRCVLRTTVIRSPAMAPLSAGGHIYAREPIMETMSQWVIGPNYSVVITARKYLHFPPVYFPRVRYPSGRYRTESNYFTMD